jgi:peroxiredoxin
MKLSFPVVHDAEHTLASRFDPPRMPSSFLIDRKGVVRYVHEGFRAGDEAEIEKQLKLLLD